MIQRQFGPTRPLSQPGHYPNALELFGHQRPVPLPHVIFQVAWVAMSKAPFQRLDDNPGFMDRLLAFRGGVELRETRQTLLLSPLRELPEEPFA
jgi:hypothetical protein